VKLGDLELGEGPVVVLWRDGDTRHVRHAFADHAQLRDVFFEQAARLGIPAGQRHNALAAVLELQRPGAVVLVRSARRGRYIALARTLQPPSVTDPHVLIALEIDREVRLPILAADVDTARAIAKAINATRGSALPWQLFETQS
jgi:hypothetical protein